MPPRREGRAARRALPTLPPEIILRIIQLSAPELKVPSFRELSERLRLAHLSNCALVSPSWQQLAQAELFRTLHLTGHENMSILKKLYATRRGKELAGLVRIVRVDEMPLRDGHCEYFPKPNALWDIVRHCHALKHVVVDDVAALDLKEILAGDHVESVQVFGGSIVGPITSRSTPRPFSNLRQLAFRNCTLFASALRPASFPHLDTLSLGLVPDANMVFLGGAPRYDLDAITHTSRQFIEGVGPQLKALSLAPVILAKVLDLVPLLTSLIVLASPKPLDIMAETADLFAVVNSLPHPLPVLHVPRFIPWPSAQQFSGPHAPKVEVIVASARQLVPDDLRAAIGKAGVELRVEADLDFLREVEALRRDATSAWYR